MLRMTCRWRRNVRRASASYSRAPIVREQVTREQVTRELAARERKPLVSADRRAISRCAKCRSVVMRSSCGRQTHHHARTQPRPVAPDLPWAPLRQRTHAVACRRRVSVRAAFSDAVLDFPDQLPQVFQRHAIEHGLNQPVVMFGHELGICPAFAGSKVVGYVVNAWHEHHSVAAGATGSQSPVEAVVLYGDGHSLYRKLFGGHTVIYRLRQIDR